MTETIKQLASADLETGKTGFQMQFEVFAHCNFYYSDEKCFFFQFQRLCKGNQEGNSTNGILCT